MGDTVMGVIYTMILLIALYLLTRGSNAQAANNIINSIGGLYNNQLQALQGN